VSAPGGGAKELRVSAAADGSRVDLFLGHALHLSRAKLKKLFEQGAVRIDGRRAKKGDCLRPGQNVHVLLGPQTDQVIPEPEAPLAVLYQDGALVFVDKPSGSPSHPLAPGELGTVANALVARFPECAAASAEPREAGLCHRLDTATSGVIVAARDRQTWTRMREAFSGGEIDKRYLALVAGPIADQGEIEVPLRHRSSRGAGRVEPALPGQVGARRAKSSFRAVARAADYALVEVRIHTGVLHQVRAHLAAIGAPVVGDALYGGRPESDLRRVFLHARSLELDHPKTLRRLKIQSPLPSELSLVLARIGIRPAD